VAWEDTSLGLGLRLVMSGNLTKGSRGGTAVVNSKDRNFWVWQHHFMLRIDTNLHRKMIALDQIFLRKIR